MSRPERRAMIGLLAGALAAPAVIRTEGLLMPVRPPYVPLIHWKLWTVTPATGMAHGGYEQLRLPGLEDIYIPGPAHLDEFERQPFAMTTAERVLVRGGVPIKLGYVDKPAVPFDSLKGRA